MLFISTCSVYNLIGFSLDTWNVENQDVASCGSLIYPVMNPLDLKIKTSLGLREIFFLYFFDNCFPFT